MTTEAWLIGNLPIGDHPDLQEDFGKLLAVLSPEDYDEVLLDLDKRELHISITGAEVPYTWINTVDAAMWDFAQKHATAGAAFIVTEAGDEVEVFGPTREACKVAALGFYQQRLEEATQDLQAIMARPAEEFGPQAKGTP